MSLTPRISTISSRRSTRRRSSPTERSRSCPTTSCSAPWTPRPIPWPSSCAMWREPPVAVHGLPHHRRRKTRPSPGRRIRDAGRASRARRSSRDWENGFRILREAIAALTPTICYAEVFIRGERHSVVQALQRSLAHLAYHVGQIVLLAKHDCAAPRGGRSAFRADARRRSTPGRRPEPPHRPGQDVSTPRSSSPSCARRRLVVLVREAAPLQNLDQFPARPQQRVASSRMRRTAPALRRLRPSSAIAYTSFDRAGSSRPPARRCGPSRPCER